MSPGVVARHFSARDIVSCLPLLLTHVPHNAADARVDVCPPVLDAGIFAGHERLVVEPAVRLERDAADIPEFPDAGRNERERAEVLRFLVQAPRHSLCA